MTDPGQRQLLERAVESWERQEDALQDLAQQIEIQNAVLLELVSTQQRANRIAMKRNPDDWPSPKSRATSVEDNVLYLAESVDVDAAKRYADP